MRWGAYRCVPFLVKNKNMSNVIVIGGGAAGMMAALAAAYQGHKVTIMEKNEKLGKKVFITGKGRCNVTNASDMDTIMSQVVSNPKFLYSAFYGFTNQDVMNLLERLGCPLKVERGNRVFPVSDHAYDVIDAFYRELRKIGVTILLHTNVKHIWEENGVCKGVILADKKMRADAVIVATGGRSYPSTGSTGDGYRFAKETGHEVTALYPALVPFTVAEPWCQELMGLSLRNVNVSIFDQKKLLYSEFGEMLFTHFGVSGPAMLSASSVVAKQVRKKTLALEIDLKPALSFEQLDARLLRDLTQNRTRQFKNSLGALLPSKLIPIVVDLSSIAPEKMAGELTREERQSLVQLLKKFRLTLNGLRDYNEAIVTQGGVSVKEIWPSTMESKRVQGLYFAGEVLDVDALTGGYNLQIAWSTGYAAGSQIPWD